MLQGPCAGVGRFGDRTDRLPLTGRADRLGVRFKDSALSGALSLSVPRRWRTGPSNMTPLGGRIVTDRMHGRAGALGIVTVLAGSLMLAGCENAVIPGSPEDPHPPGTGLPGTEGAEGSIFGEGGLDLTRLTGLDSDEDDRGGVLGVNSFLWRASLDTISFMPLASADPFGGVIITDWHSLPETPNDRFKVTVYILDRQLRADGLRVSMFRQNRAGSGADWQPQQVAPKTVTQLEDQILTRARQLRSVATAGSR